MFNPVKPTCERATFVTNLYRTSVVSASPLPAKKTHLRIQKLLKSFFMMGYSGKAFLYSRRFTLNPKIHCIKSFVSLMLLAISHLPTHSNNFKP